MKKRILVVLCATLQGALLAYCCLGDKCPNTLAEYQDANGNPTGKYSLLDANGNVLLTCQCEGLVGTNWPPANCTACKLACPKCNHDIFQHTCDAGGTPGAGTKVIKQ